MGRPEFIVVMDAHPVEDGRIQKHIRFLVEKGYVVYHLHFIPYLLDGGPDDGTYSLFGEKSIHINLRWRTQIRGLRLLNYLSLLSPLFVRQTADIIQELGIPRSGKGIIHVHDPILLPVAGKIQPKYLTNCSIVYDRHEIYEDMKKFCGIGGYGIFEKTARKNVRAVVIVSDQHRESAQESFPQIPLIAVQNFPYGSLFDIKKIQHKIDTFSASSPIICSYIGSLRVDFDRDVTLLLDVSTILLEKNSNVRIIIGGPTDDRALSNRFSRMLKEYPDRFRYIGPVSYEQVARITEDSHIGFYFLKNQNTGNVGSPNKVYEYLFCGAIPVIKGSVDFVEVFSSGSIICSPEQGPEEISLAIRQICSDIPAVQRMMYHAHEMGLQFTWENVAGRYLDLYQKIISN